MESPPDCFLKTFRRATGMSDTRQREAVSTKAAPAAIGPYSQGIVCGNLLFISGQLPIDPTSGELVTGSIEEKTRRVIDNIRAITEAAGAGLQDILKTTVFLKDMKDFGAVNAVYAETFPANPPARAAIQVAALPKDADIEIEAIVRLPV
jgi:2-iminobutanoate/2-iminopropanoate deaminase